MPVAQQYRVRKPPLANNGSEILCLQYTALTVILDYAELLTVRVITQSPNVASKRSVQRGAKRSVHHAAIRSAQRGASHSTPI